ncbi:TetR/AcrR family transcriptional regulator [Paraburkholderia unamae]|uniref:TetR/AcrR family transcriptional regulator n=1 Tax=Paraburkholderia unamae TaxID=219649 RepID=UPI000DD2C6B4|nr:TetR/AcrR family transcriptional regulator [Paraburkholderia unamae]
MAMQTVREAAKEARREAIFAAAEALIRRTGHTDFSMRDLAQEAGLSLATAYNLIGSKSTVLYALLNRRADALAEPGVAPKAGVAMHDHLGNSARRAVRQFTGDPEFFRPLMRFLLSVPDPVHRPAFMARGLAYWRGVMQPMESAGRLPDGMRASDFASVVHLVFTGALDMWIHEEYSARRFQQELDKCLALLMLAIRKDGNARPGRSAD